MIFRTEQVLSSVSVFGFQLVRRPLLVVLVRGCCGGHDGLLEYSSDNTARDINR